MFLMGREFEVPDIPQTPIIKAGRKSVEWNFTMCITSHRSVIDRSTIPDAWTAVVTIAHTGVLNSFVVNQSYYLTSAARKRLFEGGTHLLTDGRQLDLVGHSAGKITQS